MAQGTGDGPIDPKLKDQLHMLASLIDMTLNTHQGPMPDVTFILLASPWNTEAPGRCSYVSNLKREALLRTLRDWMASLEGRPPPPSEHKLVGDVVVAGPDGVTATCTCGWSSKPRFTAMVASALFRDHQENPEAPPPPDMYDVARDLCHEHGMPWTDPRTLKTYPPPPKDGMQQFDGGEDEH
jgi:hypothetical protein